ncbi:pantoate--beta-alanine ligase [Arcicella rigui]|uniref:Pantothenate synthetase n=1 Tax=Arcicella rigui TaxID=797020 RepID=A0ABU5QAA4_9BACT|nr:pantoate--beta-alanine ligase [Arcicella rigui]MEA5139562.1 pantoate--beta-alanine ligase [Arcicella rigui]
MQVFFEIQALQTYLNKERLQAKTIGFVPTMGALHEGHLSLIQTAKSQNDITVCSIFVNPTQFNNPDDLAVYPRTLEADCQLLEQVQCDVVFAPSAAEMYPSLPNIKFNFGILETVMEGKFRPGHFNGVGIVVAKLFNIVQPTKAYFGQKDLQQCAVINCLVRDLSFSLDLVICPTQREQDGLAMSSRNRNLSTEQRALAPAIYKALQQASQQLRTQPAQVVKKAIDDYFASTDGIELEYFEISDFETLLPVEELSEGKTALCIAAYLGKTRLIDNVII